MQIPLRCSPPGWPKPKPAKSTIPNAMTLATVGATGAPSARIVLLKGWDAAGFVFYTNTQSRKGNELAGRPSVALLFHWKIAAAAGAYRGFGCARQCGGGRHLFCDAAPRQPAGVHGRPISLGPWRTAACWKHAWRQWRRAIPPRKSPARPIGRATGSFRHTSNFGRICRIACMDRTVFEHDGTGWQAGRLFP